MKNGKKFDARLSLTVRFSAMLFFILLLTMIIVCVVFIILLQTDIAIFRSLASSGNTFIMLFVMAVTSVIVGTIMSAFLSRIAINPVSEVIDGMNSLASGDYSVRLPDGNYDVTRKVSDSFNKLAGELQNTEMLRSDFINNFSHEFKTPIVSILGFAKVLHKGKLSSEAQMEYVEVIEEEAERLSNMATNVLNLTKIENQSILTGVSEFNLSEQIRSCVILLEKKWASKNLDMQIGFDEHMICGNQEMLKQVWINLLDNAIKFSPDGSAVAITIREKDDFTEISIANSGEEISEADRVRIFNKFYQADVSHSGAGNGIGLAIVKRVVELHNGKTDVKSIDGINIFSVEIPK